MPSSRRRTRAALAGLLVVAATRSLAGQAAPDATIRAVVREAAGTASPWSELTGTLPRAFLSASWGETSAKISTGFDLSQPASTALGLKIELETPVQKTDEEAALADLHRLGNGTTASLGLTGTRWRLATTRPSERLEWCRRERAANRLPTRVDCNSVSLTEIPRSRRSEFLRLAGWSEPTIFELKAKAGRSSRNYLDASTFVPSSLDRVAWSAGGNIGRFVSYIGPLRAAFVNAGFAYQVDYDEQASGQVCVPIGTGGAMQCRTGAIGAPTRSEGGIANAELRGFLGDRVGINPQYLYQLRSREWQVDVPLYFVPNDAGMLIGGIAPSYASNGREWGVRVFIGAKGFGLQ